MENIKLINGNGDPYNVDLPRIVILEVYNPIAIKHIKENTGIDFVVNHNTMEAQPVSSAQIVALFLTYNFKTQYHNNATIKNTIYLKSDHHVGFQVDSICLDCVKHNRINSGDLKEGDRLSC